MKLLIKNGRVIDPSSQYDIISDILIRDERIVRVDRKIEDSEALTVDAGGCFVMPGFIDLHVHLRDPGFEEKEDVLSGSKAAVKGGFTTIVAMPNTKPAADSPEIIRYVHEKAEKAGLVHVIQAGAITKGQGGTELADLEGMAAEGCLAFSEDGKSVMDSELYRQGMVIAGKLNIPVFAHCEDKTLVAGGVMNAGKRAQELGMKGIGNYVEDVIAARDILLAKASGCRLHLCHCSTEDSVEMIRQARAAGLAVSGEVCPHHFTLTDADIPTDDSNYKMNPPLRTRKDVEALIRGLTDGTMEVISTDHAPHTREEKNQSIATAPFGIVGLETAASLTYSELVLKGYISPLEMAEKMSWNPARILGVDRGSLKEGKIADLVIFDPKPVYRIEAADFAGKSINTPFIGREVTGRVVMTVTEGRIVYQENQEI